MKGLHMRLHYFVDSAQPEIYCKISPRCCFQGADGAIGSQDVPDQEAHNYISPCSANAASKLNNLHCRRIIYDADVFKVRNKYKSPKGEDRLCLVPDMYLPIRGRFRLQAGGTHWRHSPEFMRLCDSSTRDNSEWDAETQWMHTFTFM
jgi:hypothetical protein